ncbi:MAG: cofactor-independent phosphoglycerate mutase [Nitrospirae bacterium]|nr:cofactor-independent phosphoglycerate mutase [Nitrospirota bacterium]
MKYIVIIGDGMADRPLPELQGRTPLKKARTPHMDRLAHEGVIGTVRTVPRGFPPGSDVANLSILGYDPAKFYSGRAPLEAASMGIELGDEDVAYRCNLVTLKYDRLKDKAVLEDYSAGHISTEEAALLIRDINEKLGTDALRFYAGVSYRHLMVWRKGAVDIECVPPHDITGKEIADYLPSGDGEEVLRTLMRDSEAVLNGNPVNRERIAKGKKAANSIWFWGQGRKPRIPTFREKYFLKGALVSAVDLTKGLGVYAGFEILKVPGVTGYIDTNYSGKAEYSLRALKNVDFVYIHVEAPDEAGHSGNLEDKVRAIEDFDALVVGAVVQGAKEFGDYRILVMPDHATPIKAKTHTDEPVPFVIYDSGLKKRNEGAAFDEDIAKRKEAMVFDEGYRLMDFFIKGE